MSKVAPRAWGYPVVANTTERDRLFVSPVQDQRVNNKETGTIQRYDDGEWVTDYESTERVLPRASRTVATLQEFFDNNKTFNPKDYGAKTSAFSPGVNVDALQAAIWDAEEEGGTVTIPRMADAYEFDASIAIANGGIGITTLGGGKAKLNMVADDTPLFVGSASDVQLRRLYLLGPQFEDQQSLAAAVQVLGASAASPVTDWALENVDMQFWGMYGFYAHFLNDFVISRLRAKDIHFTAVLLNSCKDGDVQFRAKNLISLAVGGTAYGIACSRDNSDTLDDCPRSADIHVHDSVVEDCPWEAFDTHGGERITFTNIKALRCRTAVAIVAADNAANVQTFGSLDCHVDGLLADSGVTDGSAGNGVSFTGATGTGGSTEASTGSIRNATIRGHGNQAGTFSTLVGAVVARDTFGLEIANVVGVESGVNTVALYHDNIGFNVHDVTGIDTWTNDGTITNVVIASSDRNVGSINRVRAVRGSKVATKINDRGIRVTNVATNAISLGDHDLAICATPVEDSGRRIRATSRVETWSADKGDVDVTWTYGTDEDVIRFATTLTANRTVTISGGSNGARVAIHRTGLGAFTLNVGGLKTIPASTAARVEMYNDNGTWRLARYIPL